MVSNGNSTKKINQDALKEALFMYNETFMQKIPDIVEAHNFSGRFERKMSHLIKAEKKFNGKRWAEVCVRYATSIAAVILCFIVVNVFAINAFNVNLWNKIVDNTTDMINISFENKSENQTRPLDNSNTASDGIKYQIKNAPKGYALRDNYNSEELFVQSFTSDNGTITYTESPISTGANLKIAKGETKEKTVGAKEVTFIYEENRITAYFTDNAYYHIVNIQGSDANEETAINIIENLEDR